MAFEVGDLVWAKMKGYPPWPAQVVEPNTTAKAPKSKKPHKFVQFFGTKDHAWIAEESITPHSESVLNTLIKKKTKSYQHAIDEFLDYQRTKEVGKQISPKIKEKVENGKKSTRVVKIVQSASKKRERNVLTQKSSIKKVPKKRRIGDDNKEGRAKSRDLNILDNVSVSSRHSVERDQSFEDLPGCSSDSSVLFIPYVFGKELGLHDTMNLDNEDPATKAEKLGFVGLEDLGKIIFMKLIKYGIDVTLWDENVDRYSEFTKMDNVKFAESPAQLIVDCDVTFCYYDTDSDAFRNLIFGDKGILEGFEQAEKSKQKHKGYVGLNSIDNQISEEINNAITVKSGYYLEAPVIHTIEGPVDGDLLVLASGSRKLFTSCEECFRAIATKSLFVSCEIGVSSKMSVLLSTVAGTVYAALSEALALSDRLRLYKDDVRQVFGKMLQGDTIEKKVQKMTQHDYEPVTPLKHVQKDINLALGLADTVSQSMPVTSAANEVFKYARLLEYSDSDVSAIYKVVKRF